jgi:hypothetical protein
MTTNGQGVLAMARDSDNTFSAVAPAIFDQWRFIYRQVMVTGR